ncbi:BadF/BadG/BcrA/BcrD ATPase family protein [Pseudochrobactrum sp. MP213Fo]|uniref:BadF/BadG/BcrA/BcrD ATPase family protein n=1 Tax=Pseudochrobactrum sp. MP213Fo TaxID=3022250 RepID=UPI003BA3907E
MADYIIGIDGGGTGCRAAIADPTGKILGTGQSGPANIMTDMASSVVSILAATDAALHAAQLPAHAYGRITACLGLAGANVSGVAQELQKALPFAKSHVVSDGIIALQGAIGDQDGVVVILGTGSVTISRENKQITMRGGWGFKVSDLGGGARLGQKLLEESLLAYDGIYQRTPLVNALLTQFNNEPHAIVRFAHDAKPNDFGRYAPLIFEYAAQNDPLAEKILNQSVAAIEAALDASMSDQQPVLSLIGGLGALYGPRLSPRYQQRLRPPLADALTGAVALAAKLNSEITAD